MFSDIATIPFALSVLAGVIGTALWAAIGLTRFAFFWCADRRGELAGWWWQITYTPTQDESLNNSPPGGQIQAKPPTGPHSPGFVDAGSTAATQQATRTRPESRVREHSLWTVSPTRKFWSIELLRMRHRRKGLIVRRSVLKGKMWRIYHMDWSNQSRTFGACGLQPGN